MTQASRIIEDSIPRAWAPGLVRLCGIEPHTHGQRQADGSWAQAECPTPGKRPLDAGFNATADARWKLGPNDAHLEAAQIHLDSGGNLGLVPPPGVMIIDADTQATCDWLDEICPASTPIMRRTESSAHYYLRFPADLPLKGKRISWSNDDIQFAFDLRLPAKNQAVVPPSMHRSGVHYAWERHLPEDLSEVPHAPSELEDLLRAQHMNVARAARQNPAEVPGHDRIRAYANRMCRYLTRVEEVLARTLAFAQEVYADRPQRAAEACAPGGEVERIVRTGWDMFGGANPLDEDRTDKGYVELLKVNRDDFLYEPLSKRWFEYERGLWAPTAQDWVQKAFFELSQRVFEDAARELDGARRDRLTLMSKHLRTTSKVAAMTKALSIDSLVKVSDLDAKPDHLMLGDDGINVREVVELESGEAREATKTDYITREMGSFLSPEPSNWLRARWLKFLQETFVDQETIAFVHRAVGLTLLGVQREHVVLFLYGRGGSGKSTFLNTLLAVFGTYGIKTSFETFVGGPASGSTASPDVARMRGARLVVCSEVPQRAMLGARLKDLTGGDRLIARELYGMPFEFEPQFTTWVAGNVAPEADFLDSGIERRLRVIPADNPARRQDPTLLALFTSEAGRAVVLQWCMEGLAAYQAAGGLGTCAAVKSAAQEYWLAQNPVEEWFRENCARGLGEVLASELYHRFLTWMEGVHGLKASNRKVPDAARFGKALRMLGVESKQSHGKRFYIGLRVLELVVSNSRPKLPDLE